MYVFTNEHAFKAKLDVLTAKVNKNFAAGNRTHNTNVVAYENKENIEHDFEEPLEVNRTKDVDYYAYQPNRPPHSGLSYNQENIAQRGQPGRQQTYSNPNREPTFTEEVMK